MKTKIMKPGKSNYVSPLSRIIFVGLSVGALALSPTASMAEPSMQEQLETLQSQLEQQQKMMQEQQKMMQEMQRQLNEQKIANQQMQHEEQEIEQQVTEAVSTALEAQSTAQQAERDAQQAKLVGLNLSKDMDNFVDAEGHHIKIPKTDTVVTISGFVRASSIHDFDQIASPTKFAAPHIVVDGSPTGQPDNRTTLTANASRFVIGSTTPTKIGNMSTMLSLDFDGNTTSSAADVRLRQAWGQLDDFVFGGDLRIGQVWTSWDDLSALPETMDFEGPNGSQQLRQPLIRWARDFDDQYTLWVSLENPSYNITDGDSESAWPDTVVTLNWHGDWGHLKPALIGRQIEGDAAGISSDTVFGWGTQLAGVLNLPMLGQKDNLKFQVVYGGGIGSYNNDGGYDDALFTAGGDLETIDSFQGFAAYQHWWTDSLRSNAVFGWVDVNNRNEQTADSLNRTLYTAGNLVWSPIKKMDMGIEYLWGERKNKNDHKDSASRIQFTTKFVF